MSKKSDRRERRPDSLSRERIVEAAIALLDRDGEDGLIFRALSERLATGPGAIYWHIPNKAELLAAACDAVITRALAAAPAGPTPQASIRTLALALFDAVDNHSWLGTALTRAPARLPAVRILERLGQPLHALGVPAEDQWATVSALLAYILGVGGQNAANRHYAQAHGLDRSTFLDAVATAWSALDPASFPFTRAVAGQMRAHDDRADFLAGIDLILQGIASTPGRALDSRP